jgi:hypothetical protein
MDDVHTETEARRLLAAAFDTIPAGADLVSGVRRRRTRHRRRAQAALAASSAATVAAVAAGALAAVTATGAPSALAAVTGAAAKTASESYRVSMVSTRTGQLKFPLNLSPSGPMRVTGEFDPARQIGEETAPGHGQIRYIGGYVYWTVPSGETVLGSKPWVMARIARTGGANSPSRLPLGMLNSMVSGGIDTIPPQDPLTLLKSVSTVRDAGPASGPGWTGTRYSFSTTAEYGPYQTMRGTVDVDRQGRVRRLIATIVYGTAFSSATGVSSTTDDITFSDFGLRVPVTAPPASQVYKEPGSVMIMAGW